MTLQFVACSGAVTHDAYYANTDGAHNGEKAQLAAPGANTSLVTLTFGGNDLGFASTATTCVTPGKSDWDCLSPEPAAVRTLGFNNTPGAANDGQFDTSTYGSTFPFTFNPVKALTLGQLGNVNDNTLKNNLHDRLLLLIRAIRLRSPAARILVLGYPHWFPNGGTGHTTEHFSNFEQNWLNDRIGLFDALVRDAVNESGVAEYVDVYNALSGHEIDAGDPNWTVDQYGNVTCNGGAYLNPIDLLHGKAGSPELLHPNPCGHLLEGQTAATEYNTPTNTPIDTFSLTSGGAHTTKINVPSGTTQVTLTASWNNGTVVTTLTDPSATTVFPTMRGSGNNVYATYTLLTPASGTWTLTETNTTNHDLGTVTGQVVENLSTLPQLPPAGAVSVHSHSGGGGSCTATFQASVNSTADANVSNYDWFDNIGQRQSASGPKHNTMTMTASTINSPATFQIILRTNGANNAAGQVRYTPYQVTVDPC
jgi:lysophospholipase L1-like esterase